MGKAEAWSPGVARGVVATVGFVLLCVFVSMVTWMSFHGFDRSRLVIAVVIGIVGLACFGLAKFASDTAVKEAADAI